MLRSIDNVGIAVIDLARSVVFYERLGFAKGDAYDEEGVVGCIMTGDSAVLFLFQTRQADPQPVEREATLVQNPPGIDHISFLVKNVDEAYAELRARGIEFSGARIRFIYRSRCPPPPRRRPLSSRRSVRGRASFTVKVRPVSSVPFKPLIAAWASAGTGISTNPNPRD